jgi:hypothetical protein
MASIRVMCVTKPRPDSRHEDITHLGGTSGGQWRLTRGEIIALIDAGTDTFHVIDARGHRSTVGVVHPAEGREQFVRAYVNGSWNNMLLALPPCP